MVNDVRTELFHDNGWNDITADVRQLDPITVKWGRADEATRVSPSSLSLRFDNPGGKYSPRNPTSPLFGKIGRNTPIRVRLGTSSRSLALPGVAGSYASTPDHSSLDITGDIDLRLDLQPETWRPIEPTEHALLMSKWEVTGNQRSWLFMVRSNGLLRLWLSSDGTFTNAFAVNSTAAIPDDGARRAVRATVDVNNGAGGNTITFYTAPTITGSWTQLGSPVVTAGTTSIFASSTPVEIGTADGGTSPFTDTPPIPATVYAAEIRNGIGGTVVANPDFTTPQAGDTTLTDSAGRVWTVRGGAGITDASVRFAGEVAAWPSRWDLSGKDVSIPLEAAGIRRRLGQGAPTLRSAMYRGMTGGNVTAPVAYWPCEDGDKATSVASALAGHPPMRISGDVNLAAHSDLDASGPIPTFTTGYVEGAVPAYTVTNFLRCMALVDIPDSITGTPNILYLTTTGFVSRWYLSINSGGDLNLRAVRRDDGVEVLNSTVDFNILGKSGLIWIYLTKNGTDVDYQIGFAGTDSDAIGVASGTVATTIGIAERVISGGLAGNLGGMAVGHITVLDTDEFWDILEFSRAWTGETAVGRITRLCAEEDVPLRIIGPAGASELVGPQQVDTFLNLVDAAAAADQGILVDDRDAIRLLLRPGKTLYNQPAALTLDYATGQVAPALEPVEDDQLTRNDITAKRPGGSSARAVLEAGPLSVQAPPNGVGRYDSTETVAVDDDAQLVHQASWLLHLGTVDEARYPQITVDLTATPALTATAAAVVPGDRVQVTHPPGWLPPDAIDQLAQGGAESLTPHRHAITFNCTPASPWTVAVADDDELGRADTEGSQLAADVTAAGTSLHVLTTVGPTWTQDSGEMPFDVRAGGEVMRVTAVTDTAKDTFTRSVSSGWGTADAGGAWSTSGGAASDYSVNGTRGLVSLGTVTTARVTTLPLSVADVDFVASVASPVLASGDWINAGLVARYADSSNHYRATLEFKHSPSGQLGVRLYKVVGGVVTGLGSGIIFGTYAAAERFWLRLQIIGSTLRVKVWQVGSIEPAAWTDTITDTALSAAGAIGTRQFLGAGNTNTLPVSISWDDLSGPSQKFTVTRSINGVSKAHATGAAVALAQPAYAAL